MDVCKCLDNTNSFSWKYSETVQKFWRIGYLIFHGKWLKFIGGLEHGGSLIDGECNKDVHDPKESCINFVVPIKSVSAGKRYPVSPSDVQPGIIKPLVDRVAGHSSKDKTYKLCVDGEN